MVRWGVQYGREFCHSLPRGRGRKSDNEIIMSCAVQANNCGMIDNSRNGNDIFFGDWRGPLRFQLPLEQKIVRTYTQKLGIWKQKKCRHNDDEYQRRSRD